MSQNFRKFSFSHFLPFFPSESSIHAIPQTRVALVFPHRRQTWTLRGMRSLAQVAQAAYVFGQAWGKKGQHLSELEVWMVHDVSLRTVCDLLKSLNTLVLHAPAWGVGKDPQHKLASSWRQGHSHHSKVAPFLPGWVLSHGFPEHSGQRINCGPSIFGDSPDSGGLELHDFGDFFFQMCKHSTKLFWSEDSKTTSQLQQQHLEVNVSIWDHGISPWRSTWDLLPQLQRRISSCGSTDSPLSQVGLRGEINYLLNLVTL